MQVHDSEPKMVRYSFLVRLSHPLLHAGLSRRILDHLLRPHEHHRWKCQAESLSSLEIDHQLKLGWLLDWKVSGFGTLQDLVDHRSDALKGLGLVSSVGY